MGDAWTKTLLILFSVCWVGMLCHSPFGTFKDSFAGTVINWMSCKLRKGW